MRPAEETLMRVAGGENDERPCEVKGATPAANNSRRLGRYVTALRSNPWLGVALRGAAIVGFMLGFAAIGAAATQLQTRGVHIASQIAPSAAVMWLAPTPPPLVRGGQSATLAATPGPSARAAAVPTGRNREQHGGGCHGENGLCDGAKSTKTPEGVTSDGKVILNVAGAEALTILPGVGKRRAEAILKLRERLGRFRRTSDLLRIRGIGVRSLKRMLPHLVLDPPPKQAEPEPKTSAGSDASSAP